MPVKLANVIFAPSIKWSVRRARKLRSSAEAALVLLAEEHGIGTSVYQRKLDAPKQAEIAHLLAGERGSGISKAKPLGTPFVKVLPNRRLALKSAIELLIQDSELRARCQSDLMASAHFDKPINQATLVLEERIRSKATPDRRLVGEHLVNYAFNEDVNKTLLKVGTNDPDDQRGFTQILRGFVPAFRNKTHHFIMKNLSREEALRVCGFVDVLLRVVDNSIKAN